MSEENLNEQQAQPEAQNEQEVKVEEEQPQEIKIEDLEEIPAGEGIDVSEYEGKRVEIEKVKVMWVNSKYDEMGNFNPDLKRKVPVLKVMSKSLTTIKDADGNDKDIRASEIVNLKVKDSKIGYSNSERSKIQKLFRKFKVNRPQQLVGKFCTIIVRTDSKGLDWLGISY